MTSHLVIDGNAFYEIDDECMKKSRQYRKNKKRKKKVTKKTVLIFLKKKDEIINTMKQTISLL